MKRKSNRLINEKSPYLLQHAYNPVEWHPWGKEAFARAREESKPIFLSIGYSTCYWCHVMEREVFENDAIAEKMNNLFVNIKVDREERPDIDRVYMTALQSMTGSGGWPMNMFLTPDLKPFYGATYIPPKAKYGRAGFEDVIEQISEVWKTKNADVIKSGEQIVILLQNKLTQILIDEDTVIPGSLPAKSFEQCKTAYDFENGGFGQGNKFPRPVTLNFLLYYYYFYRDSEALDMVTYTLRKMYKGGMHDHLGGGFHRYSVDCVWRVPHFEKMLYDQAQLIETYFDTYLITKDDIFKSVAADTINYVMNNLYSEESGFYSAEDAESAIDISAPDEKSEGEFYLWAKDVLDKLLGAEDSRIFSYYYGIELKGNTISDPHNVFNDKNVLYISNDEFECAKHFSKTADEISEIINRCKNKLFDVREKRPRPHLDDKVLTSWNGLMVSALAKAYGVTKEERYIVTAGKTIDFIQKHLYDKDSGTLYHRYREGDVRFEATLEDYSYLIKGLIDLYESTLDADYIEFAMNLNRKTMDNFYDNENGGFFDVGNSVTDVILTTKETYDGAEPSGNSIQISNLIRLGHLSGDATLLDSAEKSLKLFYEEVNKLPFSSPQLLCAYFLYLRGVKEIILKPGANPGEMKTFIDLLSGAFLPDKVLSSVNDKTLKLFPHIKEIILGNSSVSAQVFLCENFKCSLPVTDVESLNKILNEKK